MYSALRDISPASVLRKRAIVSVSLPGGETRYFSGIIRDLLQGGYDTRASLYTYEATIVPSIWLLSLGSDCKIFQKKSVPDILEQVLTDNGITDFKLSLNGTYAPREYCVQYRESNLNFISRLMEEEGISYYFTHDHEKHTLNIVDKTESAPECAESTASYSATSEDGNIAPGTVWSMFREDQVHASKVTLTDYHFETPALSLLTQTEGKSSGQGEFYDYPGRYTTLEQGSHYSDIRMDELETFGTVVRGESNCTSFTTGMQFTLAEHYRVDTNGAYLLTAVEHTLVTPEYVGATTRNLVFQNRFEAIPVGVKFSPPRRARKPVIAGSQTAVVVGTAGSEIYVDNYGRVKVQFFWDRRGKKNEDSSCWVRVSQIWAGKQWGWITIPRIGQEVVVDFLEGDPDRPLIVGRVYNAEQMPPYALPDKMTQSGIKTRSSSGGGTSNYNEIRFEDQKGSELLSVHAEKDMETEVENDDTQTVSHDRAITVKGKHTETITGNMSMTVQQGNQSTTLDQGDQSTKVTVGSASHEALQQISLKVGQSSIVMTQAGITIKGITISIEGTAELEAKAIMTSVKGDGILQLNGGLTTIN